ncbi:MAG TPA: TonB family protein [Candidatus Sulfotelmatobacter sp.]|jgi:TonB family protein|nr:TonB family protein [Candidatus Sulfotelmatobacter sp.]
MIPRTLVPTDVHPLTEEEAKKPSRRVTTYMDDRTVVPSELTDGAVPLDGKTTIPSHLPLGVLVDRTLVSRSMPAKQFESFGPISEYPALDILDSRVVVPAYVEPPEQREIDKFSKPPQMTAELRELVEPDMFNTGEANLLVEPEEKRDAKEDLVTRALSIAFHIAAIIFVIFLPKIFPPRVPTLDETIAAGKSLGVVYLPSDAESLSRAPASEPAPKVRINPKTLNKVAPPRAETHAIEAPPAASPARPPSDLPSAPTPRVSTNTVPSQPVPSTENPPPSKLLLPSEPNAQPKSGLNLGLPSSSPGKQMQDQIQDAIKQSPGGTTYGGGATIPGGNGRGGGGHGPGAGTGMQILTDTEGVNFDSYMRRLHDIVLKNWSAVLPESYYMGDKGIVVITFTIDRNGTIHVTDPVLERTSGKEALDRAVFAAIRSSVPFEPLPSQFKGPFIVLRAAFFYNIQPGSEQ